MKFESLLASRYIKAQKRQSFFTCVSIIAAVAWAVIALVVGWIVFNKFEKTFAEDL